MHTHTRQCCAPSSRAHPSPWSPPPPGLKPHPACLTTPPCRRHAGAGAVSQCAACGALRQALPGEARGVGGERGRCYAALPCPAPPFGSLCTAHLAPHTRCACFAPRTHARPPLLQSPLPQIPPVLIRSPLALVQLQEHTPGYTAGPTPAPPLPSTRTLPHPSPAPGGSPGLGIPSDGGPRPQGAAGARCGRAGLCRRQPRRPLLDGAGARGRWRPADAAGLGAYARWRLAGRFLCVWGGRCWSGGGWETGLLPRQPEAAAAMQG